MARATTGAGVEKLLRLGLGTARVRAPRRTFYDLDMSEWLLRDIQEPHEDGGGTRLDSAASARAWTACSDGLPRQVLPVSARRTARGGHRAQAHGAARTCWGTSSLGHCARAACSGLLAVWALCLGTVAPIHVVGHGTGGSVARSCGPLIHKPVLLAYHDMHTCFIGPFHDMDTVFQCRPNVTRLQF